MDARAAFPDKKKVKGANTVADIGVSAFSLFFTRLQTFLSNQRSLEEGRRTSNWQYSSAQRNSRPRITCARCSIRFIARICKDVWISLSRRYAPIAV